MASSRSSLRDWLETFSTNVLLLIVGIGTGIASARVLGPVGRGEFAEILLWGNLVAQIGTLGLPSATTLQSARYGREGGLTSTVLVLAMVYSALSVAIFSVAVSLGATSSVGLSVSFVAAYVPANIIGLSLLSIDAGAQRFSYLNTMRMIPQIVYAVSIFALIAVGFGSAESFAWSMLAGSALVPVAWLASARHEILRGPDLIAMRQLFSAGLQYYSSSLIGIVRDTSDRLVILAVLDSTALGLYAVALTIAGSAIQNVAGATVTILLPKALATTDVGARARQLATATSASLFVGALMNSVLALCSPILIPVLFGGEFSSAVPVAMAMCFAQTARSGADILANGLRGFDDWKALPLTSVVALIVFLPTGFAGAQMYGPVGVGAGLICSNFAALVVLLRRGIVRTGLPLSSFIVPPKWIFSPSLIRARLQGL